MTKQKQKRPTHEWAKDQDYWDKLSPDGRKWLQQFNKEYYHGDFSGKKTPLHPVHWKSDCVHRHNAQTNDAMAGAVRLDEETTPQTETE